MADGDLRSAAWQTAGGVVPDSETQYTKTPDGVHLAYRVLGSGPIDLLWGFGFLTNISIQMQWPPLARFFERLASFGRLIRLDSRGTGLSDPVPDLQPNLDHHVADVLAVLDAIGSEQVALIANNTAGASMISFAAAHPDRTRALVLDGCYARFTRAPGYPIGVPKDVLDAVMEPIWPAMEADPSSGISFLAPKAFADPELRDGYVRQARATASPALAQEYGRFALETDVRHLLPEIRVPTLVMYRTGDTYAGKPHAEYLAEHIAGSTLVELPGEDNLMLVGNTDAVIGEIQEFLTGVRDLPEFDRVIATVLFTDIVRSTERVAAIGDRQWKELLDRHDDLVAEEIARYRGKLVKSTGDGIVATFDGATRAIRCAQAIADSARDLDLEVRSGLHAGEIGFRRGDVTGIAVHIAQRVCGLAGAGKTMVSRTVVDLVDGSGIEFEDCGEHELKGVPEPWHLSRVRR